MTSWFGSSKPELLKEAKFSIIKNLTISLSTTIGKGSYGTVYAAEYDGKPCVAKEIHAYLSNVSHRDRKDTPTPLEYFFKEINTLSSLKHPSIVQFIGVYFKESSVVPILVMERMWKNLFTLLEERPKQLPLIAKTHILYDVACGLHYLHSQEKPVVHRDLTATNILLSENLTAKIADLGQAKAMEKLGQKMSTAPGNVAYMAPEATQQKPTYDTKLDIFSFGCTVIHTVTEEFPKPTEKFVESVESSVDNSIGGSMTVYKLVSEVDRRKCFFDKMLSITLLRQIALQCLQDKPIERPDASNIFQNLKHYLKQLEMESSVNYFKEDKLTLLDILEKAEVVKQHLAHENELLQTELNETKAQMEKKVDELNKEKKDLETKNESLQKHITQQEQVKKELVATCQNDLKRLREDLKAKQEESITASQKHDNMEKEIQDVKSKAKVERKNTLQRIKDLEEELRQVSETARTYKEENNKLVLNNETLVKERNELKIHLQRINQQADAYKVENDSLVAKERKENKQLSQQLYEMQQKNELLQENFKMQQEDIKLSQTEVKCASIESTLFRSLSELQFVYENEHQKVQNQHQSYIDLKKKFALQKQQLDEKSTRLSTLEYSLSKMQESSHFNEDKLKQLKEENAILNATVKNNDRLYINSQKELKEKEESLKSKAEELCKLKKEHADEIKNLKEQHAREIEDQKKDKKIDESQAVNQKEAIELLKKETKHKSDLIKTTEDKFRRLKTELQHSEKCQKELKRQIKHLEKTIKDNAKTLEKYAVMSSDQFGYDIHWHPYLSLPVKRIASSTAFVKGMVFMTGGYQLVTPYRKELDLYLKSLERGNEVFCFHTGKCRCDSIASPVVLGGVASVNGQCVLISGAEGNTLTGNVYVLCEEGSDEKWKKFSGPVPTPRILPCVCCYGERWLIVCGGYACKEGSNLLEAVNVVEILDTNKGEWYKLSEEQCPNLSNVINCAIAGDDIYVIGDRKILSNNLNKLITAVTKKSGSSMPLWSIVELNELSNNLYPFSVADVNGKPMIIASISGSEDDVTCVLMKDTTDTWRKMSEAVECQHCSAVVVTPTLELLLFGGSKKASSNVATDVSQKGNLGPTLSSHENLPMQKMGSISTLKKDALITKESIEKTVVIQPPPSVSFTGPIHTIQFDHKGGVFQSPVHKVSIVVPPNAIDDGEKVTVYMGATKTGPFDLPEDCKLKSAVVWLGSGSDVVLKRSIAVVVPHSAVFTSPQHHSTMRFLICEDCEGPRYTFQHLQDQFDIDKERGWIELSKFVMVAIATSPRVQSNPDGPDDEFYEAAESLVKEKAVDALDANQVDVNLIDDQDEDGPTTNSLQVKNLL